jgi:hypothetical protein
MAFLPPRTGANSPIAIENSGTIDVTFRDDIDGVGAGMRVVW